MILYTAQPPTVNAGLWEKRRVLVGIPYVSEYYPGGMMLLEVFMLGNRAMLPWILIGLILFGACEPDMQRPHEPDVVTVTPLPSPSAPVVDEAELLNIGVAANQQRMGLGRAIAKGMIELCGGRIWVESTLGQGSRFTFSIPKELAPARLPLQAEMQ